MRSIGLLCVSALCLPALAPSFAGAAPSFLASDAGDWVLTAPSSAADEAAALPASSTSAGGDAWLLSWDHSAGFAPGVARASESARDALVPAASAAEPVAVPLPPAFAAAAMTALYAAARTRRR
ncbi:MAG TPA: hypothetical protein VF624_00865 [Tepidisphaeraceae bacterium]|jgi:hypothetical protein